MHDMVIAANFAGTGAVETGMEEGMENKICWDDGWDGCDFRPGVGL